MIKPILFWNLRGLGTSKRRLVKLVHLYKPKIIALAEPFLNVSHLSRLQAKLHMENSVSNEDSGGKIWLLWAAGVKVKVLNYFAQSLTVSLDENNCQFIISFIYATCRQLERRDLWDNLHSINPGNVRWMVLGDFNIIRVDGERRGGRPRSAVAMAKFNSLIEDSGLVEMNYEG
ncbi:uncharacterized protein LOC122276573 [Carya illinoinensis]|uniref:uncharacterized protein LOC122276573 n=1 Tax=Carya illinoinensis TaxID=32201 RepID=UPI001C724CE2|nr:uncharacterized protein LOC122276573 [Carya illinoinensis]